jgi:epoxyqueuosine reductase
VQPYVVDSNRCLSYLTIEHRGPVEGEITGRYDGWLFGCDACQDVCPWNNRFAQGSADTEFQPREGNLNPDLESLQAMTEPEFRARYDGSAILRARHEGLMRNVRILKGAAGS